MVAIPTVHLWRFEELLAEENIMRTGTTHVKRSVKMRGDASRLGT